MFLLLNYVRTRRASLSHRSHGGKGTAVSNENEKVF